MKAIYVKKALHIHCSGVNVELKIEKAVVGFAVRMTLISTLVGVPIGVNGRVMIFIYFL